MPQDKARAVFAIYAFCRLADDAIDVYKDAARLDELHKDLTAMLAGRPPEHPLWLALADTFAKFDLDAKPFYEMLAGQKLDASFRQPRNEEELLHYCYLVAGTVGLMLSPLLSSPGGVASGDYLRTIAIELRIAMQLTNILRDIGTDYRQNRIYIPLDLMQKYSLTDSRLADAKPDAAFVALWEYLAREAEQRYSLVRDNIRIFDHEGRLPVLLALEYYSKILGRVRKAGYRVADRRIYVPDWQKLIIYMRTRSQWQKLGKY